MHPEILLACYRYYSYKHPYDPERIWSRIDHYRGYLSVGVDSIDFWIPTEYQAIFVLEFPLLERKPNRDYV